MSPAHEPLPEPSNPARAESGRVTDAQFRALVEAINDYAIFHLDLDGRVISWNSGAEKIKGYRAEEILGKHVSTFYPPDVTESGWPAHEFEIARTTGRFEDEGWRVRKDGTRFWANVVITLLRDENGQPTGFGKITRDLSDRRRQEESLRQSEERQRLMIEAVEEYAIFMLDPAGHVSSWNAGARRISGYRADEALARPIAAFYTLEDVEKKLPERELHWAQQRGRIEDEGWRVRKDRSRYWANTVITALHDRDARLVGFVVITRDMTERRKVATLEESSRQMQEFLAMLAHELRNPLAPIRTAAGVLSYRPLTESSLDWSREVIERQVGHLTRLVDDLLDVSRVASGRIVLRQQPIEMADVVTRAVEAGRPAIDDRRQELDVMVPADPLCVCGDSVRLVQMLVNLLNNASKYTPAGGRITLCVAREDSTAVIRVRDTGVGMAAETIPRVFDLFFQGPRSQRSENGLGVGLTLVHRLVGLHGGSVEAHSQGENQGSEFVVRLPLVPDPVSEPVAIRGASTSAGVRPRRVLVVDDNRDAADSMALLLRRKGHEVRAVHDGPGALKVAAEYRPEIVLLDIGLPGMSGYQVAELLRGLPGLRDVTLVAVTGYGQEEDRRRALAAGLDRHLVKPVELAAIEEVLDTLPDRS